MAIYRQGRALFPAIGCNMQSSPVQSSQVKYCTERVPFPSDISDHFKQASRQSFDAEIKDVVLGAEQGSAR